jgi:hypothetical protein
MIFLVSFSVSFGVSQLLSHAAKAGEPKKEEKSEMICVSNEVLDKLMTEKNYDILLNMTNSDGVVESIWTGGQSIVITAAVPNEPKSCLLATMSKVTYNPKAIEEVWETYKKQTKQKDI